LKAIAVFPDRQELALIEHERPRLENPDDVLLRVLDVGVCGTDKEICAFDYGTPPAGSPYLVIGHECLAEVAEVGPAVEGLEPGDLVVPSVRRPCGVPTCAACREGRQDFCFTGRFQERGIKERHGFMTELLVDRAGTLSRVPRELRDLAVLVEPLTIAEKALQQVWQMQARLPWTCDPAGGSRGGCHRAVVLGAGPVGLLGAMALRNAGFDTTVYSREPAPNPREKLLASIGVRYLSSQTHDVPQLAQAVGAIDLVYEAVGASSLAFEMLRVLGPNGIFVFTGVPGRKGPVEVDTDRLMRDLVLKNQAVFGSVNADRSCFDAAVRDLQEFERRWPQAVRGLITGRYPRESYRELLLGKPGGIKNVLAFSEAG
jgi:threonine dehydrogenase-like Zn-dependent dehydrogenase